MLPGNPLPQGMVSPPVDCGWVVGCCCYKRSLAYARRRHIQQAHPKQAKFVPRCFPHPELQIANKQVDPKRSAGLDVPQVCTSSKPVHLQSRPPEMVGEVEEDVS